MLRPYHHTKGVDSFVAWGGYTPRIDDTQNKHAEGVRPSHYWSHTFGVRDIIYSLSWGSQPQATKL